MPVTLAEASKGAQTDLDTEVIDEFRKSSEILDSLVYDQAVNPSGGGAVMTYGYRRLATQVGAAFRTLNTEYTPGAATTSIHTVTLAPLGGSYQIDRVIATIGAPGENALQMAQVIKSTKAKFNDAVINGDTAVEANGFDGLDKALTGSSTEIGVDVVTDWSDFDTSTRAEHRAIDAIDEFLGLLDGAPSLLIGNRQTLARVRAAARRAGQYTKNPIEDLTDNAGRPIFREYYGNLVFVDAGEVAGSAAQVIPVRAATVDGVAQTGLSDLYAVRIGMDGFHAVTTTGDSMVKAWLPDHTTAGAVKTGEVELGPIAVALKATKAAAVLRNIKNS